MIVTVYVPATGSRLSTTIKRGSAIAGTPEGDRVLIDYEGNLYNAVNMHLYEEKLLHAAGRHVDRYPTRARMLVPAGELVEVGSYDTETSHLTVTNRTELEEWADGTDER